MVKRWLNGLDINQTEILEDNLGYAEDFETIDLYVSCPVSGMNILSLNHGVFRVSSDMVDVIRLLNRTSED